MSNDDVRGDRRQRRLKGGSISFLGGTIDCIVRDISNSGAALEVESPVGIPDDFTLIIKPEHLKRECHVVWRSPKKIGVRFV